MTGRPIQGVRKKELRESETYCSSVSDKTGKQNNLVN